MTHLQTARLPQALGLIDASSRVKAEKASTQCLKIVNKTFARTEGEMPG
jgi:hypothetical protein